MAPARRDAHFAWAPRSRQIRVCRVRNGIEALIWLRAQSDGGADIGDEAVGVGPVMLGDRPGIRPGAKEQFDKAVIEEIEKARKGIVLGKKIMIAFLGGASGRAPCGPEQAEKLDEYLERLVVAVNHPGEVRGREIHIRILPELTNSSRRAALSPMRGRSLVVAPGGAARRNNRTATARLPDFAETSRLTLAVGS